MLAEIYLNETLISVFLINTILAYGAYAALMGGSFNLSFPAFVALGAYSSAVATTRHGANPVLGAVLGLLLAAVSAVMLGFLLRRLEGLVLAIAAVNVMFFVQILAVNLVSLTGGASGIIGIDRVVKTPHLIVVGVTVVVLFYAIAASRVGSAVALRRDDPTLASVFGMSLKASGHGLTVLSAIVAAVGGSVRAHWFGFVEPTEYGLRLIVLLTAMVVLGGLSHWAGPILGSMFFTFVPEWSRGFGLWRLVAIGIIVLIVVRFAPDGFMGLVRRLLDVRSMRRSRRPIDDDSAPVATTNVIPARLHATGE